MAKKKEHASAAQDDSAESADNDSTAVNVSNLKPGQEVKSNNGNFYHVLRIDPVIDPRKEVYEHNTNEALVFLQSHDPPIVLMSGSVSVKAA